MAPQRLETLPPELLLDICEYINDTHRPSLEYLALTSKAFVKPCSTLLFRKINLHVKTRGACQSYIDEWLQQLSSRDVLKHVRTVEIHGFMADDEAEYSYFDECQLCPRQIYGEPGTDMPMAIHDHGYRLKSDKENEAFIPISAFIQTLPHASAIIWSCHNAVPACILTTAETSHPMINLHVRSLKLFHLDSNQISTQHLAILRSPSLRSLTVHYLTTEMENLNPKTAILKILACLAPNLRHLLMIGCRVKTLHAGRQPLLRHLDEICEAMSNDMRPAKLESLRLYPGTRYDEEDLRLWYDVIDPPSLRCLELGSLLSRPLINWLSANARFDNLRQLTFPLDHPKFPDGDRDRVTRADDIGYWFSRLQGLTDLSLSGPLYPEYVQVIESVLLRHGRTLTSFTIVAPIYRTQDEPSQWKTADVDETILGSLCRECPNLETLTIPVRRRRTRPMRLFEKLASFPRLRSASLDFDGGCWGMDARNRGLDQTPEHKVSMARLYVAAQLTAGRVRRALKHAALDESLAEQIWHAISSRKVGTALVSLDVKTSGGEIIEPRTLHRSAPGVRRAFADLFAMFQEMERTYVVSRSVSEESDELEVREIGKEKREAERWDVSHPNGAEMEVFRSIWPETSPGSDWRTDWRSIPLEAESS